MRSRARARSSRRLSPCRRRRCLASSSWSSAFCRRQRANCSIWRANFVGGCCCARHVRDKARLASAWTRTRAAAAAASARCARCARYARRVYVIARSYPALCECGRRRQFVCVARFVCGNIFAALRDSLEIDSDYCSEAMRKPKFGYRRLLLLINCKL